jgi:hypothetical protein
LNRQEPLGKRIILGFPANFVNQLHFQDQSLIITQKTISLKNLNKNH